MSESNIRVGDDVKVLSGVHEGKRGRVLLIREPDDVLFEKGKQPIVGLLSETMALVEYRDDFSATGVSEVGVPVRRLEKR